MILAIDFDGVIHDHKNPIEGRRMGGPIEGAKEQLTEWHDSGHTIIIHSLWGGKPDAIAKWMEYYQIPYNEITNIKPQADYYIDDKAIRFESWLTLQLP